MSSPVPVNTLTYYFLTLLSSVMGMLSSFVAGIKLSSQRDGLALPISATSRRSEPTHRYLRGGFLEMFWIISSMGLPLLYRHYWAAKHTEQRRPHMSPDQLVLEETGCINDAATTLSLRQQWIRTVRMMFVLWKGVIAGCALILGLSTRLLQDNVNYQKTFAKTATISGLVFASAAILSGGLYLSGKIHFESRRMESRWKEASTSPTVPCSTEFWACLALPLSYFIWSVIFNIMALIATFQAPKDDSVLSEPARDSWPVTAIIITMLIIVAGSQIYRAVSVLKNGHY